MLFCTPVDFLFDPHNPFGRVVQLLWTALMPLCTSLVTALAVWRAQRPLWAMQGGAAALRELGGILLQFVVVVALLNGAPILIPPCFAILNAVHSLLLDQINAHQPLTVLTLARTMTTLHVGEAILIFVFVIMFTVLFFRALLRMITLGVLLAQTPVMIALTMDRATMPRFAAWLARLIDVALQQTAWVACLVLGSLLLGDVGGDLSTPVQRVGSSVAGIFIAGLMLGGERMLAGIAGATATPVGLVGGAVQQLGAAIRQQASASVLARRLRQARAAPVTATGPATGHPRQTSGDPASSAVAQRGAPTPAPTIPGGPAVPPGARPRTPALPHAGNPSSPGDIPSAPPVRGMLGPTPGARPVASPIAARRRVPARTGPAGTHRRVRSIAAHGATAIRHQRVAASHGVPPPAGAPHLAARPTARQDRVRLAHWQTTAQTYGTAAPQYLATRQALHADQRQLTRLSQQQAALARRNTPTNAMRMQTLAAERAAVQQRVQGHRHQLQTLRLAHHAVGLHAACQRGARDARRAQQAQELPLHRQAAALPAAQPAPPPARPRPVRPRLPIAARRAGAARPPARPPRRGAPPTRPAGMLPPRPLPAAQARAARLAQARPAQAAAYDAYRQGQLRVTPVWTAQQRQIRRQAFAQAQRTVLQRYAARGETPAPAAVRAESARLARRRLGPLARPPHRKEQGT